VEELLAAIAAHLRAQRRQFAETVERETAILGIWHDPYAVPRYKVCGAAIEDDDGGLYTLADMRAVRECRDHYMSF